MWLVLAFFSLWLSLASVSAAAESRTWKTLAELSTEERAGLDLSSQTPRHPQFSYLPAELYPFTPPYTAEEMGLRAMEFSYWKRWSSSSVQAYGSIDAHGYMPTWGKCITSIVYQAPDGLAGYLYAEPGQNYYRALLQYSAPPEASGNQTLYVRYRTDHTFTKKQDTFRYASALRRVRRYPAPPRQNKYPGYAFTYDDDVGRDAWEFAWRIVGTDVLYETVRFPVTRPTITLADADGTFTDVPTNSLKLMGADYPLYTAEGGGVKCYVVEATAKPEWLPNYYAPRILYWLDQHAFFPLRIEEYGRDGQLIYIGVRLGAQMNPALAERGYGVLINVEWDPTEDLLSYVISDANLIHRWSAADQEVFFTPEFLTRAWTVMALKSQAEVATPEQFFLRPAVAVEKFPEERRIELSPELTTRIHAQEHAGRLVFRDDGQETPPSLASMNGKPTQVAENDIRWETPYAR